MVSTEATLSVKTPTTPAAFIGPLLALVLCWSVAGFQAKALEVAINATAAISTRSDTPPASRLMDRWVDKLGPPEGLRVVLVCIGYRFLNWVWESNRLGLVGRHPSSQF